jgi:hypothetical protein
MHNPISLLCHTSTARPSGYAIGYLEDEGEKQLLRANGFTVMSPLATECTFFKVDNMTTLPGISYIPDGDVIIDSEMEIQICADKCASFPVCVYFETRCFTYETICEELECSLFELA